MFFLIEINSLIGATFATGVAAGLPDHIKGGTQFRQDSVSMILLGVGYFVLCPRSSWMYLRDSLMDVIEKGESE